ncbi:ATP-grasp domain-containing protein [Paraburkholderia solisilvae]|uniref:ATP-grasp domain-containing protein n=1 Tax=Paraburkholderia solisilvae TaxID=624376 RepID=A0A6J5DC56_9BURK|nr:ATP-grasp domain-containing protein [Paraburkholderia solisilvae]CAB3751838.1 hypothetical protein LMG29739_01394 [Paraburkholderia solisilvae]
MTSIVIVEPASSGVALAHAAARLGIEAHVVSAYHDDSEVSSALEAVASSVTKVDTYCAAAVADFSRKMGAKAIVPGFEYVVGVAADAASRLGLPHLEPDVAELVRDKYRCRMHLAAAGLAVPGFARLTHADDVAVAAEHVGFPAVLKPTDGCGSLRVVRIDSRAQLQQEIEYVARGNVTDMGRTIGKTMLLEQYLNGPEYSIEGCVGRHGAHVLAVTEKLLGPEPYFVEMGHTVEAGLAADVRARLVAYIEDVVDRIGLTLGVFHAEARLTREGPVLIEIAARLGGDRIYRLVELSKSISLPEVMIRSHLGDDDPIQGDIGRLPTRVSGVRFIAPHESGCLTGLACLDELRALPGCEEAEIYGRTGEPVQALTDFRGRVGHVLFAAPDRETLERRLAEAACLLGSRTASLAS